MILPLQVKVEHRKDAVDFMCLTTVLTNAFCFIQRKKIAVRYGLVDEAEKIYFQWLLKINSVNITTLEQQNNKSATYLEEYRSSLVSVVWKHNCLGVVKRYYPFDFISMWKFCKRRKVFFG